ncbi:Structural maintenance of chromosomes protein 5 [Coemansia javaensis]|uniref:Structural maintenance of chromosomes protein 5 n=1 Tax=Coemansia javaensis TaxID=2761396 RepID=A0A9W8LEV9_9FUNG|nr:Structural maintenance of chromosomes protein 5 [Coemansia javaensis]
MATRVALGRQKRGLDENMPPARRRKKEEALAEAEASDDGGETTPQRRRLGRRASAAAAASEDGDDDPATRLSGLQINGTGGYRAGAIMRIRLESFVTYDRLEVEPGPNMNMIIGPNGTGKSTIVCAIALGLGERPAVLGRAKDVAEFVKHGAEQATIEITLAGHDGPVRITRTVVRENSKTRWAIDGRGATAADVQRTVQALHVQVGNLCQFLPQDRVVEFSKMPPADLLRETQRAVGREDLLELQRELAAQRREETKAMADRQRLAQDIDTLRKQNEVLERDVQRWQERQAAESQMRVLTALVPVARYSEAKDAHDRAREARREAHSRYQEARGAAGPAEDEMDALETRIARAEAGRRAAQDDLQAADRAARQLTSRLGRFEETQRDLQAGLEDIGKRAQRRREQIARLRAELADLEAAHAAALEPEGESRELAQAGAEISRQKLELKNEIIQLQDQQKGLVRAGRQVADGIAAQDRRLRDLDDVALRRREALRRVSEDSVRALEWLEQNRGLFEQHVFAPVCLEASVPDARYAPLIETVVAAGNLRMFVTQCDADYYTFTREVNDRQRLRVDVVRFPKALDAFRAPVPRPELQALGFDGYALDFIEAPAPVLAALCSRDSLHAIPLALGPVDNERVERAARFKEYLAAGTRFSVARGRYGSRAATVMTSRVRPQARLLSQGESDEVRAQRDAIRAALDQLRDQAAENERSMARLSAREQKVRNAHRDLEARETELRQERQRIAAEIAKWERQKVHIDTRRAQLASAVAEEKRDGHARAQAERARIQAQLRDNARARADAVAAIARAVREMTDHVHAIATAALAGLRDARALADLKAAAARHREAIAEAQQAFDRANDEYSRAKAEARRCLDETRSVTEDMTDEERQAVRDAQEERRDVTSEELELELAACRQRISMAANSGLSARVMEQHAERKARLAAMAAAEQDLVQALARIRKHKLRTRRRWEGPLQEIIDKIAASFAAMFDRIGCMGEVALRRAGDGIRPGPTTTTTNGNGANGTAGDDDDMPGAESAPAPDDEDYGAWGVEIRVAFRKDERMRVLDNHRQSGGERAVSTILYLQSMQDLVAAPFRVVDEINQGMDQRNERLIHEIIVSTACQPGSSQYFLITPKLLPDLDYHPLMKVLCIFNGEWQPQSLDVARYINNARAR